MDLRTFLKEHGMKQTFMAEKLGVHKMTIRNWVTKKIVPSAHFIVKIEEFTNGKVKLKDFIESKTTTQLK